VDLGHWATKRKMKHTVLFIFSIALFTASRALRPETLIAPDNPQPPAPCDACLSVVSDAEDYLADPKTQDAIVAFVQTNVCAMLPQDSSRTCAQEARVMVAQAVASMEQYWTPDTVCAYIGICDQPLNAMAKALGISPAMVDAATPGQVSRPNDECPFRKFMRQVVDLLVKDVDAREKVYATIFDGNVPSKDDVIVHMDAAVVVSTEDNTDFFPGECPLCKLVMDTVMKRLRDPDTRKIIYEDAMDACKALMDDDAVVKCCAEVDQLFASVDALLDDMDAHKVCQVLQFCYDDDAAKSVPPAVLQLRQAAAEFVAVPTAPSPENCEACERVVKQADIVLMVRLIKSISVFLFW
jgi:hypothetical protein